MDMVRFGKHQARLVVPRPVLLRGDGHSSKCAKKGMVIDLDLVQKQGWLA